MRMRPQEKIAETLFFWIVPPAVYIWHASLTGSWIVDDAGITFAYAKNLALGRGIISQPGALPTEGYSNPLWMLIFSLAHFLGIFHEVLTPKILSGLCFLGMAFFVRKMVISQGLSTWNASGILLLLAVNSPLVIWANSGLENGLYVFLLSALLYRLFSAPRPGEDLTVSFLLMLTRPEAFLWGLLFPLAYFLRRKEFCGVGKNIGVFLFGWVLFLSGISLFRRMYFGDWLPNTFYAKMPSAEYGFSHLTGEKARYLSYAVGGFWALALILISFFVFLIFRRLRNNASLQILFSAVILSVAVFAALPDDWMRELRFGTPFVFFFTVFAWFSALHLFRLKFSVITAVVFLLFFGYQAYHFTGRTKKFMEYPTVPLAEIKKEYTGRYNRLAEIPGLEEAEILIPDVGAMYYYGRMRVMDAAGLTDKNIALRLRDSSALRNWVLEERQPEFIHLHGRWSLLYNLQADFRFGSRYKAIREFSDSLFIHGRMHYFISGDYAHQSVINHVKWEELKRKFDGYP